MGSIFLSHNAADKAFVEKLASDLKSMKVNVWFDKWRIGVGDSLLWKIEEGIRENEFLGVVMSPEAMASSWVRSELAAAWSKQIKSKSIVVLPILLRDCEIPLLLADLKYADFRTDYQAGLETLGAALGVDDERMISADNWRRFARQNRGPWKNLREREFVLLVTRLLDRAVEYNWSSWVGASRVPFSMTVSAFTWEPSAQRAVSIRLDGRSHTYKATNEVVANPNRLSAASFTIELGDTVNECEEYAWRAMDDFRRAVGDPTGEARHSGLFRKMDDDQIRVLVRDFEKAVSWYHGDNSLICS